MTGFWLRSETLANLTLLPRSDATPMLQARCRVEGPVANATWCRLATLDCTRQSIPDSIRQGSALMHVMKHGLALRPAPVGGLLRQCPCKAGLVLFMSQRGQHPRRPSIDTQLHLHGQRHNERWAVTAGAHQGAAAAAVQHGAIAVRVRAADACRDAAALAAGGSRRMLGQGASVSCILSHSVRAKSSSGHELTFSVRSFHMISTFCT